MLIPPLLALVIKPKSNNDNKTNMKQILKYIKQEYSEALDLQ